MRFTFVLFLVIFLASCVTTKKEPTTVPSCKALLSQEIQKDAANCKIGKPVGIDRSTGYRHSALPLVCDKKTLVTWYVINSSDIDEVDYFQRNKIPFIGACKLYETDVYLYRRVQPLL